MSARLETASSETALESVPFREAFWTWVRVALYSFGGPAAQIAVMHRILVDEKRWVSENRFLHALNYCMLLPGPEAQQLATYIGWLLHRTLGGLVAGILFVLPGFITILALSLLYAGFREVGWVEALFFGLKPAVLAVVLQALYRIGSRALKNRVMFVLAGLAFIGIFFFDVPFPIIIVAAALIGYLGGLRWPDLFFVIRGHKAGEAEPPAHTRPSVARAVKVTAVCLTLWFVPLLALALFIGSSSVYVQEGIFFSKAAVVTFGGAYAVLAYIAQQAVETYEWLQPGEMLDGLGMAETTPGPLIQVVQFVGFMGAYRHAGALDPMVAGILASVLVTWVTFVPCFLWIFLGAPYIEALRGNKSLSTALSGITAAVVGVVLNLALWFGLHTLFGTVNLRQLGYLQLNIPEWATLDPVSLGLAALALVALVWLRWPMIRTLLGVALLGMVYRLVAG
ncbi:MAG: chromate efflux transporter [Gammaproteobacteria bacterium]|nr:chromate efflux transporter [Gammaproteobacteria bacterium]NIR85401.1 chromate efflux transporter [Gammaproteobacteria bacterium]NIU03307.1 chromate efflux transporter [Gammaproteobacteria bacterium]NIV50801.1 chromate efflux transporter [Gammaproteobacteria bacterium]NIX06428.1 chromate efflux transporter [Gammaproteobacteria bacterium]